MEVSSEHSTTSLKGHDFQANTRHRLDWLERNGRIGVQPKRNLRKRLHYNHHSSHLSNKLGWMLIGALGGSLLTQLLQVVTIIPMSLENVGRHEEAVFEPFLHRIASQNLILHGFLQWGPPDKTTKSDSNEEAKDDLSDLKRQALENSLEILDDEIDKIDRLGAKDVEESKAKRTVIYDKSDETKAEPALLQIKKLAPQIWNKSIAAALTQGAVKTKPNPLKAKSAGGIAAIEYMFSGSSAARKRQQKHAPKVAFDPVFVNLPPPPELNEDDYVSACLLIKDDNHWLVEWLAYHFHALPLRELHVAVDPESKTTPRRIFERWTSRNLMNITIWEDKDIMPKKVMAEAKHFDNNTDLMLHRVRQTNFIKKCIPALRRNNAKWAMLIDTDEFVSPSYGSWYFLNVTDKIPRTEYGNVLRMLKYHEQLTGTNHTCVYMPRFFYGAKESPPGLVQQFVPKDFDAQNFLTQRFLYRDPKQNPNGKNMLNMKRVPKIEKFESVHKISSVCPEILKMYGMNQQHHAIVRIHHYLGTEEQHFFRDDPRTHAHHQNATTPTNTTMTNSTKNKKKKAPATYIIRGHERYQKLNAAANHKDDGMLGWVHGFIRDVGMKTAKELLKGVGEVGVE